MNKKIIDLDEINVADGTDYLVIYNRNAVGIEKTKKIELYNAIGYEEGIWTPVLYDADVGGNAATAATSLGTYTKFFRLVTVTCKLNNINTAGLTGVNQVHIGGFPYRRQLSVDVAYYAACQLGDVAFDSYVVVSYPLTKERIVLTTVTAGGGADAIYVSDLTSGAADIRFTMTYEM